MKYRLNTVTKSKIFKVMKIKELTILKTERLVTSVEKDRQIVLENNISSKCHSLSAMTGKMIIFLFDILTTYK